MKQEARDLSHGVVHKTNNIVKTKELKITNDISEPNDNISNTNNNMQKKPFDKRKVQSIF